ncbi:RpiB/LacA/LacB family sugar-phosphate isomerase [bacterium]|jgi:ribose 5-phosphate isomerase B|nr:RpiB/LacA/LacB family sugar-phosphate isomerase [bacterium]MBT4649151.1 RpiB/LacA/LacB family sugar-phosphate isomerase [bacterium]
MTIYLGADHNGFKLKKNLKKYLLNKEYEIKDLGNTKHEKTDDYPNFAEAVSLAVAIDEGSRGILICGSGQGMCMAANRFGKIRAAFGYSVKTAKMSRHDEDSNILCLAAGDLTVRKAKKIIDVWLSTSFSEIKRHKNRIQQLKKL